MLENSREVIESAKYKLAEQWSKNQNVKSILQEKGVDTDNFLNQYAIGVLEYFLGVLKHEKTIGDCPVMHTMLNDFADSNLKGEEVFMICAQLKRILIGFAFDNNFSTKQNIDQLNYVMDENFRGVIRTYDKIIEERANKLERLKSDFLQNMSHEIRTPLNCILGMSQILKEHMTNETDRHYFNMIIDSSKNIAHKASQMLMVSKLTSGVYKPLFESINVNKLLNETAESILQQNDIQMNIYIDTILKQDTITTDTKALKIILDELLGNAVKFLQKSSAIEIRLTLEKEILILSIENTANNCEVIQDTTETRAYDGMGLGLNISRMLAQQSGGNVIFECIGEKAIATAKLPLQY